MNDEIDRLCSRHIAKCLDRLELDLSEREIQSIKRSFRFLSEDIKQVITKGDQNEEKFYPTQGQSVDN